MQTSPSLQPLDCDPGVPHVSTKETQVCVLIVDDSRTNLVVLSRLLEKNGYRTLQADCGSKALETVQKSPVDLVLLDLVMPEMDGFEVLRQIRSQKTEADLPVIMVTSTNDSQQIVTAFDSGANDYVTRPIDAGVTLARIGIQVKLRQMQAALRESEERYVLATRGTNDGLWDWNLESNKLYYSDRWKTMLGIDEQVALESPEEWFKRVHAEDVNRVISELRSHLKGTTPNFETELRILHEDGGYRWMLCRGVAVRNAEGKAQRIAGSLTDITEGKVADALTGLPNRLLFLERVRRCIELVRRNPERRFAVLFLDLDDFKLINDSLGHEAGDQLLVAVARRLEEVVRSCESIIARIGGDEFTILIEDIPDKAIAKRVAQRIFESLRLPFDVCGREVFAQASIGVTIGTHESTNVEDVLREADIAMYQVKTEGKSGYREFDQTMHEYAAERFELQSRLGGALERDEFVLHYQPIFELATGEVIGFEALIRWEDSELGLVSPGVFIPIAEQTGLIVAIGRWVLENACQQLLEWKKEFDGRKLMVSVNVSARQLAQTDVVEEFQQILHKSGITPDDLKLELTESAIMQEPEHAAELLQALRDQGIRVGIDDFGTGYSSLAYLHHLPFDMLKIDRSFVSQMTESETNASIVKTILALASNLKLDVVAEGIETHAQREALTSMKCPYGQGFLFSPPLSSEAATRLLCREQSETKMFTS